MRPLALTLALAAAMWSSPAGHPVIRHLTEFLALNDEQADAGVRCDVTAVVTLYKPANYQFYVQEGDAGVYVGTPPAVNWGLKRGDLVRIEGKSSRGAYAPIITPDRITRVRSVGLPAPVKPPSWSVVRNSDQFDSRFAEFEGRLLKAKPLYFDGGAKQYGVHLELRRNHEVVDAILHDPTGPDLSGLIQSDVVVRGVITPSRMVHRQRHDAWLAIASLDDISKVHLNEVHGNTVNWEACPKIPLASLLTHKGSGVPKTFFRTEGVLTYVDVSNTVTIQDGFSLITATASYPRGLRVGRRYEVLGRLVRGERQIFHIEEAQFRDIGIGAAIPPRPALPWQVGLGELEDEIVSVAGKVSDVVVEHGLCLLHVQVSPLSWEALLPHDAGQCPTWIPAGSLIDVTGKVQHRRMEGTMFPVRTTILLRSPADVRVISAPSWWRRLPVGKLALIAAATALLALLWIYELRRRVRAQTSRIEEQKLELEKAREKAEEVSRLKGEFLANMSHEIRTPMNGVLGMTQVLLETELTAEQQADLLTVKCSAESLLTILNDILDFSKIEAGKLSLDPTRFNLRDCLEEAIRPVALTAARKKLELVCDIAEDVPEFVIGDSMRLRQILLNLCGNAAKFTDRGDIVVEASVASAEGKSVLLHFTVADTGIGIPPDQQSAIFDVFVQADASTTRQYGGTGLGLAISSRLVQIMGGRIWVESEPGRGSRFQFTAQFELPESAPAVAASPGLDLTGVAVLIVDDNAANRRVLANTVSRWGMRPSLAMNGREAMLAMQHAANAGAPFAVVLCDVNMPEMDGFEFSERVLSDPGLHSRIILLTSGAENRDAARCRELDIAGQLTKPVRRAELSAAIVRALSDDNAGRQQTALPKRHPVQEHGSGLRILVAEDNAVNQHLIRRLLDRGRHRVVIADNGEDALRAARRENFDLVLMDVQMPKMDGLEATTRIREAEKATGAHVCIVAITAHAMAGDREQCLAAGVDGYLPKPIRADALAEIVATVEAKLASSAALSLESIAPDSR